MKLLKKIVLALLCSALSASQISAVIVEAWALKNPYHADEDNRVLGLSDLHNFPHSATERQLEAIKNLIKSYKPEDVCVVVEAFEFLEQYSLPERTLRSKLQDCGINMLNQIAAYCVENGVEVHSIDFRKVCTGQSNQGVISITRKPEDIPNLVSIIRKQIETINTVNPTILNRWLRMLFNETFNKGEIPPFEMLKLFTQKLVDARIVAHVCETKKKITIVIAGTAHTIAVRKQLQSQMRYEFIAQDEAIDMKQMNQLANKVNKNNQLADQLIKPLDIQKFAEKVRESIKQSETQNLSAPADLEPEPAESKESFSEDSKKNKRQKTS